MSGKTVHLPQEISANDNAYSKSENYKFNRAESFLSDNTGSAVMMLGLLFIFAFFLFSLIISDFMILKEKMQKTNNAVLGASLAGLAQINQVALSYHVVDIDPSEAENTFNNYLYENYHGDTLPVIKEFEIYNGADLPAVCSQGSVIKSPTLHVVLEVSARRPVLSGLFGDNFTFTIHSDCDNALKE